MNRNELLVQLAMSALGAEQERLERMETKAAQYLAAITLLAGAAGFSAKWAIDNTVPPAAFLDWCVTLVAISMFLFIGAAWFIILSINRVVGVKVFPLDEGVLSSFEEAELDAICRGVAQGISDALTHNREVTDRKGSRLVAAHRLLNTSACLLLIFGSLYLLHSWN